MSKEITKSPFYILFVDDEENARKYFDKGLKNEFLVLTASSVEEAKKIISEKYSEIAVVITDQRMPGGNGIILLKYLRENYPNIIRLLTTAYSDLSEAIEAVNSGEILRYLQKPWDYNILKSEMKQAIELFELRFERNQMMREKLMVKKKMLKVERAKTLILIAKFFNFLNFSDSSIYNFINKFSRVEILQDDNNWQDFDFGKQDILETNFYLDLIEKLQKEIPTSGNYNLDQNLTSIEIKSLIEAMAKTSNLSLKVEISNQVESKVSQNGFNILLEKLLKISALSQKPTSIIIDKIENGMSLNVSLDKNILVKNDNIFISNPSKLASEFYVNLLICYLIVGNNGGIIDILDDNQNLNFVIKIPNDLNGSNFIAQSNSDLIENIILSSMLY